MPVKSLVRICLEKVAAEDVPKALAFEKRIVDLGRTVSGIIPSAATCCCDLIVCCDYVWGNIRVRYRHDTLLGELTYDYLPTGACMRWRVSNGG